MAEVTNKEVKMTVKVFLDDVFDVATTLNSDDDVYVAKGVTVASSGSVAIKGTGSFHRLDILGSIITGFGGIEIGDDEADIGNVVNIFDGAAVRQYGSMGCAVTMLGGSSILRNDGDIWSANSGIMIGSTNAYSTQRIVNTGSIEALTGIVRQLDAVDTISLTNSGTIKGFISYTSQANAGVDQIVNTGKMLGDIYFHGGDDSYDGRKGGIAGGIYAGEGNDTLLGGNEANYFSGDAGDDRIDGGAGNDTLRGADGKDRISGGTGNDHITGEAGTDTLSGGDGNDVFYGGSENDSISGGAGNDMLHGQTGADILNGGAGKDQFVFEAIISSSDADRITDFNVADDTILLSPEVPQLTRATRTLSASGFFIGAAAHDKSDRVVYDRTNGNLYYDDDGSGSHGAILIATLDAKLALTNADFMFV